MQLPTSVTFNRKLVETTLRQESKYISDILSLLPYRASTSENDDNLLTPTSSKGKLPKAPNKSTSRAKSLVELQSRLQQISSKKDLSYKEKLLKKNLKAKLKKKNKRNKVNIGLKSVIENGVKSAGETTSNSGIKEESTQNSTSLETAKITFSKFDFSSLGKKQHKEKQNPQKSLEDLQKRKEKLTKLKESGEVEKVKQIKEKTAWKNAIAKAGGEKIKDDELLLMKTIKKEQQQKKKSKKKWEARQEGVQKALDERQKKRQDNIDKRKKSKKLNKMKKAAKKGRIIPGM